MSARTRAALVIAFMLIGMTACDESVSQPSAEMAVHKCTGSGRWFPGSAKKLRSDIEKYLAEAEPFESDDPVVGLIAPHAGYTYSGRVAGYAYRAVQGKSYSRVVVLAGSHRGLPGRGVSVGMYRIFETPLGDVPVDEGVCRELLNHSSGLFTWVPAAHSPEHSLENHLPFLQVSLGEFELVPLMFGSMRTDDYKVVASALDKLLDGHTLFVASTDFTHYGRSFGYTPFRLNDDTPAKLEALTNRAFDFMKRPDPAGFRQHLAKTQDTICGRVPVTELLELLSGRAAGHLLKYDTSGRMTGDYSSSVSYASIVFTRANEVPAAGKPSSEPGEEPNLTEKRPDDAAEKKSSSDGPVLEAAGDNRDLNEDERATLLKLARRALEAHFGLADEPQVPSAEFPVTQLLEKPLGVFVTLKKGGELRGCIGHIQEGDTPLYKLVGQYAVHSAIHDSRFRPMTKNEVEQVHIEISVMRHVDSPMSPFKECKDVNDIVVGRDGLLIRGGSGRQGILLPQVPVEQNWDLEEYLLGICRKAGLPPGAWRDPSTELYTFSAQVFGE